jgi:phosphoglycerate kinase
VTGIPTLADLDVQGRTVLVRADLNVPLEGGVVVDDFRIRASLPTIEALRDRGGRVVVCSHLGRPDGRDLSLRMDPVAVRLGELGGFPVLKTDGVIGPDVERAIGEMAPGTVAVLENTRFEAGEKANDSVVADGLAAVADVFVLDAFGAAHRAHASTVGVAERVPSAAGLLVEAELAAFEELISGEGRPYVVVLGGAKISDELRLIERVLPKVDLILVGGGMCFTLLAAAGYEVGTSLVEDDLVDDLRDLLRSKQGGKILLPDDIVAAARFAADSEAGVVPASAIGDDRMGLDVGPGTVSRFGALIESAARVFWNGPMGVFEWPAFRGGTAGVAAAMARSTGFTVVGGGDSVAALRLLGGENEVSHVSTGGGAGLALLEGRPLPGIDALRRWSRA